MDTAPLYGLDIETDTSTDGLDPARSKVLAAAVATADGEHVLTGDERALLTRLDRLVGGLAPGIIVTWNGGAFDLPFLAHRARALGQVLGLRLRCDDLGSASRPENRRHPAYWAAWHGHRHLDAYQLWRPVRLALGVSASLKSVAHNLGLSAVVEDASSVHELDGHRLERYVASDARLTRLLAARRWPDIDFAVDPFVAA